mgnify:CR=1 FL=1
MLNFFNKRIFILFVFPFILGGINVLGFMPFNLFFLNAISLSVLFYIIFYVKKKTLSSYRKKPFLKNLFFLGSSYGFGFFLFGVYWITFSLTFDESFQFLIPFALILIPLFLSLFFSLPIVLMGYFIELKISSIILISILFSIVDFLRSFILGGFPWNIWAYSFSWSQESLQILSHIGFFSFNLILITLFFLPATIFLRDKLKYFFISFFIILFFSNYFYGSYKINSKIPYKGQNKINFKIVTAGMNLNEFKDQNLVISKLIKISEPKENQKTIFVWPEGVILDSNLLKKSKFKELIKSNFSKNHLIIIGANTQETSGNDTKYFNSLIIIDNEVNVIGKYNKQKLVPFGEFLPFEKALKKVGLKKVTAGYNSFSKGNNKSIITISFDKNEINLLSLICYEIIFPSLIQKKNNHFNFIINISEDAWFGESIGPHQHFAKAIFRSIESRSLTIRSANKGISAFISPEGKILKTLKSTESGNIEIDLPILKSKNTNMNRDLIFALLLIVYAITFLVLKKFKL